MLEDRSDIRSEFCDGEIYLMAGGSLNHNRIVSNLVGQLQRGLEGTGCEVFRSDVRLFVEPHALFTYPDVMIVCGEPRLLANRADTLTDARIIIEVLSPTTEEYDRSAKFRMYSALKSLQEYIMLSQDEPRFEGHLRQARGRWLWVEPARIEGALKLQSLEIEIPVEELYRRVSTSAARGT